MPIDRAYAVLRRRLRGDDAALFKKASRWDESRFSMISAPARRWIGEPPSLGSPRTSAMSRTVGYSKEKGFAIMENP